MAKKKKVAILYGGRSVEHAVSVNSARNIFEFLDKNLFEPIPIGISKSGQWFLKNEVNKEIEDGEPIGLTLHPGNPELILLSGKPSVK
jgi:D-alanine-D-alanine ligase